MSQPVSISYHYSFLGNYPFDGNQVVYPASANVWYRDLADLLASPFMRATQYVGNTIIDRSDGAIDGRLFRVNSLQDTSDGTVMFSDNRRTYYSDGNPNTTPPVGLSIAGALNESLEFFDDDICFDKNTGNMYRRGDTGFGIGWVLVYAFSALVEATAPTIDVVGTTNQIHVTETSTNTFQVALVSSPSVSGTYYGAGLNIGSDKFIVGDTDILSVNPIHVDLGAGDRLKLLPGGADLSTDDSTIQWQHWTGSGNRLLGVDTNQKAYDTELDPADLILGSGSETLNNMTFWDSPDGSNSKIKEVADFKYIGLVSGGFLDGADILQVPNLRMGASGDGKILAGWVKTSVLEVDNVAFVNPRTVTWANANAIDLTTSGTNIIKITDGIGPNRTVNLTGLVEGANYIIFMTGGNGISTVTLGSAFATPDGGSVFTPENSVVYAWTGVCLDMGDGNKLYGVVDIASKNLLA
jgi:hypothetical protein